MSEMEKTLLEATLEAYLPSIGFALGKRVYSEDKDMQVDIEDSMGGINPAETPLEQLLAEINGEKRSVEQVFRGDQELLERRSNIINGLGFEYTICCTEDYPSTRTVVDHIIKNREFGNGGETLHIYYNFDYAWNTGEIKQRDQAQFLNEFYGVSNLRLSLEISSDKRIKTFQLDEPEVLRLLVVAGCLESMKEDFNGQVLDEKNMTKMMSYLKELKEITQE